MKFYRSRWLYGIALLGVLAAARESGIFPVLKSNVRIGKQDSDFFLLPTNQLLRPWGEQAVIKGRPVDLAFDSQRHLLAVLNGRSVLVFDGTSGALLADIPTHSTSYTGVAFRPDDRELWVSEASRSGPDSIFIAEISDTGAPGRTRRIALTGHPVPAGITFSANGATAYAAFSRNNTVAVIDAAEGRIVKEIPVGIAPFAVAFSQKHGTIFVSNRGGRRPRASDTVAPSSGSAVVTDGRTGAASTGTVSIIDAETFAVRETAAGLAPAGLALSPDGRTLAVANSHSDSISLIDAQTLARTDVPVPTWPDNTLGSQPSAVVFSPDGRRLYAACGGNNAIAVLTASASGKWKAAGAIPTGWFPSGLAIDSGGALRVINIKGVGNTATGRMTGNIPTFNSRQYEGTLLRIPAPAPSQIAAGTREVKAANSPVFEAAGGVANLPSLGIEHVFFIIKENRTYDQVFGDIGKGNSEPALVFYGRDITPNHHALAERYVLLDNFYTGGAISFDGHQWLMQAFVSDYVERAFASSPRGYAWNMSDALTVSPAGFFWQSAARPLNVRAYGEFSLPAVWNPATQSTIDIDEEQLLSWSEYWHRYKEGKWQSAVGERSGVPVLANIVSPRYPFSSTTIPDQIRAAEFLDELAEQEKSGVLPNISIIHLNNDHTNGTRPGSPTPRAMVADNDLALGRVVEGISKSRFWPKSLILVVEDDAQDGTDHVDGHRTVALAIGPAIRRGVVDSTHYNHTSLVRTIQEIFQIPARTRFLASARPMTSIFTTEPDLDPWKTLTPKVALDEMNPQPSALGGRRLWAARQSMAMNWKHPDDINAEVLNRILWWDAKGYDVPYPRRK